MSYNILLILLFITIILKNLPYYRFLFYQILVVKWQYVDFRCVEN